MLLIKIITFNDNGTPKFDASKTFNDDSNVNDFIKSWLLDLFLQLKVNQTQLEQAMLILNVVRQNRNMELKIVNSIHVIIERKGKT